MQVGDAVQVAGTVKDIVVAKDTGVTNVLVQTPGATGREYWFQQNDVVPQSAPTAAEAAAAEAAEPPGT